MKKSDPFKSARRRALRGLATTPAIAAGAIAVVAGQSAAAAHAKPEPDHEHDRQTDKGYQDTQHVRDYYRTASF